MFLIIGERSRAAAKSSENLCLKCLNYSGLRYALDDREERVCIANIHDPRRLRGPVAECSDFADKTRPSKYDMNKIAWAIEPSKRRVGFETGVRFVPPSERNDTKDDYIERFGEVVGHARLSE